MKSNFLLTLGLQLLAAAATAQTTADSAAAATPPSPLTTYGFVDGYYGYDFQHAATNQRPGFLYSHNRQNEFTVNNAVIGLRYDNGQARGALGLHAGTYVAANYAAEDPVLRHVYEAYAGFRPFQKAWLDLGIFASHIGFESAVSKDNWTLTRSLMAENSPYYESGARFTFEASPKLTLTGLVLNGWQNIRENNQAKALGTQLQWRPTDKLLVNSSGFYGNEQPQDSVRRRRYFHDFYVSYAATPRLSLALVFDVGTQEQAARGSKADTWHSGAAFVRYKLAAKWTAAARAEYYAADHGVIISSIIPAPAAPDFRVQAASLNLDYAPATNVVFRVEGRAFRAREPFLTDRDGRPTDNYGNLTSSIALSF
ncbi:porin [Hymenobacter algoricola]|uniref:Porin n=1 Tax=Hymenobacter algoricola TaxID=486267 RepID=A0ABP7N3J8_9BACT